MSKELDIEDIKERASELDYACCDPFVGRCPRCGRELHGMFLEALKQK